MKRNAENDEASGGELLALGAMRARRVLSSPVRFVRDALRGLPSDQVLLLLGGVAGVLAILVAVGVLAFHLRARAIQEQESILTSNALILATSVESLLQAVELVESDLVRTMQDTGINTAQQYVDSVRSERNHNALRNMVRALPFVNALLLVDNTGKVLNFSRYWPVPNVNVADRDYFITLASGSAERTVSVPFISRTAGIRVFNLARRFSASDGTFIGVITASIDLDYLTRLFGAVSPAPDATISLIRTDGVVLARYPAGDVLGAMRDSGTRDNQLGGAATSLKVSPANGRQRLSAVRTLAHYPVALRIARDMDDVLRRWRLQVRYMFAAAGLLDASLLTLIVVSLRHRRNRDRLINAELLRAQAEAELAVVEASERSERELAAYYARFNIAVNNLSQGLCMFDADRRLIISNPRLAELFRLGSEPLAVGTPMDGVIAAATGNQGLSEKDVWWITQELALFAGTAERASLIWDLSDGRALSVHLERTPERGFLLTFEDITERRQNEARIAHMARHDALTGLPNRVLFQERLRAAVALAARGMTQAVLCLDLDRFKNINDTLGHPVGDGLLRAVTARIRRCIRDADTVARLGGDEFAVILSSGQQYDDAAVLGERLIEELSLPYVIDAHQVVIGVSIGIAVAPDDGLNADTLLKNADLALYRAKEDGRGCCRYFRPDMDAALQMRRVLEMDLRRGVARQEFELHYQPVIRAETHRIAAFEALLRWPRPGRTPIGPADFIPVAEDMGLIIPLGKWILETACRDAITWPEAISVAVNLSPAQFRNGQILDVVRGALAASGLDPVRLELEITENVLLHETEETLAVMHELRGLGVRISMDDFGSGYSSLSYLLKFPFDKVKIDRSFMTGLGRRPRRHDHSGGGGHVPGAGHANTCRGGGNARATRVPGTLALHRAARVSVRPADAGAGRARGDCRAHAAPPRSVLGGLSAATRPSPPRRTAGGAGYGPCRPPATSAAARRCLRRSARPR